MFDATFNALPPDGHLMLPDMSCASVTAYMAAPVWADQGELFVSSSCSADPLAVGSTFTYVLGAGQTYVYPITALTGSGLGSAGSGAGSGSAGTLVVSNDLFNIDAAGGAQLAAAIVGVWAVGWAFKMLIKAMHVDAGVAPVVSE